MGDKTAWDWLQLLIVPAALAAIGIWFSAAQDSHQQRVEDCRAQGVALQAYLDQMSQLILERDLRDAEADSEARTLARAHTITVLDGLESNRKTAVLTFLIEAGLLRGSNAKGPVTDLHTADLHGVEILGADLSGAGFRNADLTAAELSGVDLAGADLRDADLSDADLSATKLSSANLMGANLSGATLDFADCRLVLVESAKVADEQLDACRSLEGAVMPDGSEHP